MAAIPYRYALHMDGFTRNHQEILSTPAMLDAFIRQTAKIADMVLLNLTITDIGMEAKQRGQENDERLVGYSALGLILTSHIAIHTFPRLNYFMFDIVSCKEFNHQGLHKYVINELNTASTIHELWIDGGHLMHKVK